MSLSDSSVSPKENLPIAIFGLFLVLYTGLKISVILGWLGSPTDWGPWWGRQNFSDHLSLIAGRRFADDGFLSNYFTSNMSVGYAALARAWVVFQVPQLVPNSALYYTHYGSLDSIFAGIFMKFGVTKITTFYVIMHLTTMAALAIWVVALSRVFTPMFGAIAGTAVLVFPTVWFQSESITAEGLSLILTFIGAAAAMFAFGGNKDNKQSVARFLVPLAFAACFLTGHNNPITAGTLGASIAAFVFIGSGPFWRRVLVLAGVCSGFIFGYASHFAKSAWVLGGWKNWLADMTAALKRRSSEFAGAVEWDFRHFDTSKAFPYLEDRLVELFGYDYPRALLLVAISLILLLFVLWRTRNWGLHREVTYALLVTLGGLIFPALFLQAAVSQPVDVSKALVPGMSLLIAAVIVTGGRVVLARPWPPMVRTLSIVLCILAVQPVVVFATKLPGYVKSQIHPPSDYMGGAPAEIQAVTDFVRESTKYGDIVFSQISTGWTGMLEYPHPAWEYLTNRRIEPAMSLAMFEDRLGEIEIVRAELPFEHPARSARVFLLLDRLLEDQTFLGKLAANYGSRAAEKTIRLGENRVRSLVLYELDGTSILHKNPGKEAPFRASPEASTRWTEIETFEDPQPKVNGMALSMARQSIFFDGGGVVFNTMQGQNQGYIDWQLGKSAAVTAEIRLRIDSVKVSGPDLTSPFFALLGASHEVSFRFLEGRIALFEREIELGSVTYKAGEIHKLRLAISDGQLVGWVDDVLVAKSPTDRKSNDDVTRVQFGDFNPAAVTGMSGVIDYIAISSAGAYGPGGVLQ